MKGMFCRLSRAKCFLCVCKELKIVTRWLFPVLSPFQDSEGLYMCYIYVCYIYPVTLRKQKKPSKLLIDREFLGEDK